MVCCFKAINIRVWGKIPNKSVIKSKNSTTYQIQKTPAVDTTTLFTTFAQQLIISNIFKIITHDRDQHYTNFTTNNKKLDMDMAELACAKKLKG